MIANEVCEGYVFTGFCLSTGGSLSKGGSLSRGCLCRGGSLSGGLCHRDPTPPLYGNVRAVRILLECILVDIKVMKFEGLLVKSGLHFCVIHMTLLLCVTRPCFCEGAFR